MREAVGAAWDALDPDDPAVQTAVAGLRRECTAAKETLSADTEVMIPVLLPGLHTMVRLGRAEFEDMIRPAVAETVEALRRAVASAEVEPGDLDAVLLVGGSSRIPLVAQLVSAELGRPVAVDADPKAVVAAGAALAARSAARGRARDRDASRRTTRRDAPGEPAAGVRRGAEHARSRRGGGRRGPVSSRRRPWRWRWRSGCRRRWRRGSGRWRSGHAAEADPAAPAAEAAEPVDPWTGDPLAADAADPGAQAGTPEAVTTPAGPRRARAVAARVRPVARNVPTGAGGAGRPVAPAAVAPAPARPPAVRSCRTAAPVVAPDEAAGVARRRSRTPTDEAGPGRAGAHHGTDGGSRRTPSEPNADHAPGTPSPTDAGADDRDAGRRTPEHAAGAAAAPARQPQAEARPPARRADAGRRTARPRRPVATRTGSAPSAG